MKGLRTVVIGVGAGLALVGCAKKPVPPPPPPTVQQQVERVPGGVQVSDVVTVTAVVKKIDQRGRLVTLLGPNGQQQTLQVGPEVQNLPQVRRGDHVVVQYTESVALRLKKPGAPPEATVEQEVGRAEPGQMPGAEAAQVVKATAKIVRIDRRDQTATLVGPRGKRFTVKVKDPTILDRVRVGDRVQATYRESLAISVQPAPTQ
jgi:Cu/Ag efflux protein CusF